MNLTELLLFWRNDHTYFNKNRAKNELDLANAIFKISTETKFKLDLELKEDSTYFNALLNSRFNNSDLFFLSLKFFRSVTNYL